MVDREKRAGSPIAWSSIKQDHQESVVDVPSKDPNDSVEIEKIDNYWDILFSDGPGVTEETVSQDPTVDQQGASSWTKLFGEEDETIVGDMGDHSVVDEDTYRAQGEVAQDKQEPYFTKLFGGDSDEVHGSSEKALDVFKENTTSTVAVVQPTSKPRPENNPFAPVVVGESSETENNADIGFSNLFSPNSKGLDEHASASTAAPTNITEEQASSFSRQERIYNRKKSAENSRNATLESAQKRSMDNEELWQYIPALTDLIAKNESLSSFNTQLVFTQNKEINDAQIEELKTRVSTAASKTGLLANLPTDQERFSSLIGMLYDELTGISVLGPLWRAYEVSEIIVNDWNDIRAEISGVFYLTGLQFRDLRHAVRVSREFGQKISQRSLSISSPMITAELPEARVTLVSAPIAKSGVGIALRKFKKLLSTETLLEDGAFSEEMLDFLKTAVRARATILVSGGTGTGKTTILNTLSAFIPENERVVTVEDAFELTLANSHAFSMQSKEATTVDDTFTFTLEDLVTTSLRLRPDRIVVGEIRTGGAADAFLYAAGTGHPGSLSTLHSKGATYTVNTRLPQLLERVSSLNRPQSIEAVVVSVHVVVQLARKHGKYYIDEIVAIDPSMFDGTKAHPVVLFKGKVNKDGTTTFIKMSEIPPETELAELIEEYQEREDYLSKA